MENDWLLTLIFVIPAAMAGLIIAFAGITVFLAWRRGEKLKPYRRKRRAKSFRSRGGVGPKGS